jgi:hypothetical protein
MSSIETGYHAPPVDESDELDADELPLRRRRRLPLVTGVLLGALVASGAFVGGVEAQKHYGSSSSSASSGLGGTGSNGAAAAFARGRSRGAAQGGAAGGPSFFGGGSGNAAGGFTTGLVTVIRGSTLYVTDFGGNTVKVTTSGARVSKTTTASLKSIHPGDSVVVRGTTQKNGNLRASAITLGGLGGGNG